MSNPTQDQQLATVALKLASSSTAPTDDQTQQAILVTKQWLARIARGEVVLVEPSQSPKMKKAAK